MAKSRSDLKLTWWLYDDEPAVWHDDLVRPTLSWRLTDPFRRVRSAQVRASAHFRKTNPDTLPRFDDIEMASLGNLTRLSALRQRLEAVAPHLAPDLPLGVEASTTDVVVGLADAVRACKTLAAAWLFSVGFSGVFPESEAVRSLSRRLATTEGDTLPLLLEHFDHDLRGRNAHFRTLQVVSEGVVADVDFCARYGFMSGVQRVVRNTLHEWEGVHETTPVAWTADGTALRRLTVTEKARVVDWTTSNRRDEPGWVNDSFARVIVPWNSTLFLPEVATPRFSSALASLVEHAGNRTVALGYDAIPVTNGAYVSTGESLSFARYLSAVKHADLVLPISAAAGEEFAGFAEALPAQGLRGPSVEVVGLPTAAIDAERVSLAGVSDLPLVLSVGSHEIRKNQIALAFASEILWRKGFRFMLLLIGGSGPEWYHELSDKVSELAIAGHPVTLLRAVTDDELSSAYANARFTVFTSVHEGYGLPITESLAAKTPVITTNYGSMAEIARDGGCVTVDPTDIQATADAMERLLTDDDELARLVAEIDTRPERSWADYADEVWTRVRPLSAEEAS